MTVTPDSPDLRPRVGIPWRTTQEERSGTRQKLDYYFASLRQAGADPVAISLQQSPAQLADQLNQLDAFVLPGSPSDVDPARYAAARHPNAGEVDENRDRTDAAVLEHALAAAKPVLAICYGCQALNVFLGGTLIQDIPADLPGALLHGKSDLAATAQSGDLEHEVALVPGSRLAALSGSGHAIINTSHHQAIDRPGKNLRVTAQAPDGIVEAVEWQGDRAGDNPWVVGVQWHPERMPDDRFSHQLFQNFVTAVRTAHGALSPSS